LTVSLYPDERIGVFLRDPDAKKLAKAWGDSLWEDEIDWTYFQRADGAPIQQALAGVGPTCERVVLRQKRQAELREAIEHFLSCGEESPPSRRALREELERSAMLAQPDEDEDEAPPKKKSPRKGPLPPDKTLRHYFEASVCFSLPDELWVRL